MLPKVVLVFFIFHVSGLCFAQQHKIDSLESLVLSVPADTTKVWLLNELVTLSLESDNNKALKYAQEAKDLAQLLRYTKGLSKALIHLGWAHYRRGDYSKSLDLSTQALKLAEELNDLATMATATVNVAAIYFEQKQFLLAIENFKKASHLGARINNGTIRARCYNNIAFAFFGMDLVDSANVYALQALHFSKDINHQYMVGFAHRTLGDINLKHNKLDQAFAHYDTCLQISRAQVNNFLQASVLHRLGKVYFQDKKYDEAIRVLEEDVVLAQKFSYKDELERTFILLSEIYFQNNDVLKAYDYQSRYVALHDSLYSQRSSEQIALMQIRFDSELKQTQIELLTKEDALKAEQIKRQQFWIYSTVAGLFLLVIVAFILIYNNRHTTRAKNSLEEKNHEIQEQAHQLRHLNSTKDKLFSIISHDLRSPLASLKGLMEIVNADSLTREEFVDITKVLKRNLDSVYDDLNNLLVWAQTQLRGIKAIPEEVDLYVLIEQKLELFSDQASIKKLNIINAVLPETMVFADRNHIGLVIRNLLANGIKFNRVGGTIHIGCEGHGELYEISVTDSGVGISEEDLAKLFNAETHFSRPGTNKEKGIGIGLLLAKEFIEKNGGTIHVESIPGKGATFTFTLKASRQSVLA
jgi:two-component system, sensor histidine kinase and response regulator